MGLYNFAPQFVGRIEAGAKRHTIRAPRRHPDRPGNTLYLYTGLRHPGARLLARVQCTAVDEIVIDLDGEIAINGRPLSDAEAETLARLDGFDSLSAMLAFWQGRLPFQGHIIYWAKP